jgi:hypothetical protein
MIMARRARSFNPGVPTSPFCTENTVFTWLPKYPKLYGVVGGGEASERPVGQGSEAVRKLQRFIVNAVLNCLPHADVTKLSLIRNFAKQVVIGSGDHR